MRYLTIALAVTSVALAGCGVAAKVNARNDMEASKAAYKACLAQSPNNVHACDAARAAYDADMRAYRATSAGILLGRSDTVTINSEEP